MPAFGQQIPFYSEYKARSAQNDMQGMNQLQQFGGVQQVFGQLRAQQEDAALKQLLAETGGDVEKALQATLKTGNLGAAAKLAPLVKMAQEQKEAESTRTGLAALFQPQAAATGATTPAVVDPQARIQQLQQAALLQAKNPRVFQSYQTEIDRLQRESAKPAPEKWSDPYQLGGATVQKNSATGQIRTVVQRPPAGSTTATETPAGLSAQYTSDPTYRKNVDFWAQFMKDGGTLPPRFAQSGAGKKMMPDIVNVVPTLGGGKDMLAAQVDLTGQKSQARAVGTRSAAVEMAAGEAREMMPILISTSENFKRTGYQPINKVIKSYQDNTGSVESRQFGAALNTFINVYARAISPSGVPTVSDKDHAREVLSQADSHEQLVGLLKVLDQEMVAAQAAPARVREAQRRGITGEPATGHGDGWSIKKK